jgi:hypothetical protein
MVATEVTREKTILAAASRKAWLAPNGHDKL